MTTALVLAGHGSHISPNTAGLVWKQVDRLRAMGVVDEITAAFWKEMPSFHTVFNSLTSDDITVIPLFTAQGYFTQTVIPAEMGLTGAITRRDGRTFRYARTLSEHPYLAEIVRRRVVDGIQRLQSTPEQTAVAIIGHSTRRNPESRRATEAQAEQIRAFGLAAEVQAVFLDDSPAIADIYRLTRSPNLIAVPYFLAPGSHTTLDVPRELALRDGQTRGEIHGRHVLYTDPVGTEDSLGKVILELAREAGAILHETQTGSSWNCFPMAGNEALMQRLSGTGEIQFGQLTITPTEIRCTGDEGASEAIDSPAELRAFIREKSFRSLATANDLPGGWRVTIHHPEKISAVVETIYPGAMADWAAHQRSTLAVNTLAETIGRQTGNYRHLETMNATEQAEIVSRVCAGCIRHATWFHGETPVETIPCPEACNHWLSVALGEQE